MKKVELTHDIIAEEVFNSSSELHRMRRDLERRVKDRFVDYQDSGIPLSMKELHLILPYLGIVRLPEEQRSFVLDMERRAANEDNRKIKRRKNIIIGLTSSSVIFIILSIFAFIQWDRAEDNSLENLARSHLSNAKNALASGEPFIATRLAEQSLKIAKDPTIIAESKKIQSDVASYPIKLEVDHGEEIMGFGFLGTENSFYSISGDGILKIWSIEGDLQKTIDLQTKIVRTISSFERDLVATLSEKNEIRILNEKGLEKLTYKVSDEVIDMDFSQDGKYFLLALNNQATKVLSIEFKNEISSFLSLPGLKKARFVQSEKKDENFIISISDSAAILWDFAGNEIESFTENLKLYGNLPIYDLEVAANNRLILFHSFQDDFIFDVRGYPSPHPVSIDFNSGEYQRAKFSGGIQKNRLVGFSKDSLRFIVWNYLEGKSDFVFSVNPYKILGAQISKSTKFIVCSTRDNTMLIFKEMDLLASENLPSYQIAQRLKCKIKNLDFSKDEMHFLSFYEGTKLKLWNLD